jgi:cysteine desulfurase
MNLDLKGFCVSTGAACSSGSPEPSPVLRSMGLSIEEAQSSLRVSIGWETTEADILAFQKVLIEVVERLRSLTDKSGVENVV